jgi:hypothetical protein
MPTSRHRIGRFTPAGQRSPHHSSRITTVQTLQDFFPSFIFFLFLVCVRYWGRGDVVVTDSANVCQSSDLPSHPIWWLQKRRKKTCIVRHVYPLIVYLVKLHIMFHESLEDFHLMSPGICYWVICSRCELKFRTKVRLCF